MMASPQQWADAVTVYPPGQRLPASFTEPDFAAHNGLPSNCGRTIATVANCFARYVTLHPGQADALVFVTAYTAFVFEQDTAGQWHKTGELAAPMRCLQMLRSGIYSLQPRTTPDLVVDGHRLSFMPFDPPAHPCPMMQPPT